MLKANMFKPPFIWSNKLRRIGVTTSEARSHADAADGPQPIVFRPDPALP
ncbi:MAG: hypothetical protein FWD61_12290 [Phycisphaerales bacterium]|nr:hypothetical protein [Phycisphaerales bacterium]